MHDISRLSELFRCLTPAGQRRWLALLPLTVVVAVVEGLVAIAVFAALRTVLDADASTPGLLGAILPDAPGLARNLAWALPVLGLAGLFVVKNGVLVLASWFRGKVVNDTEVRLSTRLLATYLNTSYARLRDRDSAELIRNLLGTTVIACATLVACVTLIANLLVSVAVLTVVMTNAPGVALIAALYLVVASALIVAILRKHITRWGGSARDLSKSLLESLQDTFGAVKDIKLLHREDYFLRRFAAQRRALAGIQRDHGFVSSLPRPVMETLFVVSALGVWAMVAGGDWSGEEGALLGLYLYAGLRLVGSFQGIISQLVEIRFGLAQAESVIPELSVNADAAPRNGPPVTALRWTRAITFDAVSLAYAGARRPAVRDISLTVDRGQCLGIVGATGAGKSTLAELLMGLLTPSSGEIRIDGAALSGSEESWQRGIGFVAPATFLINDTLRRNIAFGVEDDDIDERRLADAIEAAQLTPLLADLDGGLGAVMGERGARLSGGERQRIGVARALYQRPHTLVLDEALAAVDVDTESRILTAIRDRFGASTLIIITHRPCSLRFCDRVVLIESGRLSASGDYETLALHDARFMRLMQPASPQGPEAAWPRYSTSA